MDEEAAGAQGSRGKAPFPPCDCPQALPCSPRRRRRDRRWHSVSGYRCNECEIKPEPRKQLLNEIPAL